jgi:hypothetical protein
MRMNVRGIAAALMTAAVLIGGSGSAMAAGALAVNNCGAWGTSYGYGSMEEAVDHALGNCQGRGCHVVVRINGTCGAFAWDAAQQCGGAQGWAYAGRRHEAEEIAVRECYSHGGRNCEVRAWVCDGR